MIGRAAIALICVMAPASLALGYWQGQSNDLDISLAPIPASAPTVVKPSEGAADAVRYLASINGETHAAAATPSPKVDASAPQVDIAVQFRRDVTAVLTGDEPHVVLSGGKQLGAGEIYRDGWRIRDLSGQRATLTKGTERRDVDLFSAPPMQLQVASASGASGTPLLTGPIELSNGLTAEQKNALLQNQRNAMMQMLQQAMRGGMPPGGFGPGGQGGPGGRGGGQRGGGFGGAAGAGAPTGADFSQFRQGGFGGRGGRQGGGGGAPSAPAVPDSQPPK